MVKDCKGCENENQDKSIYPCHLCTRVCKDMYQSKRAPIGVTFIYKEDGSRVHVYSPGEKVTFSLGSDPLFELTYLGDNKFEWCQVGKYAWIKCDK